MGNTTIGNASVALDAVPKTYEQAVRVLAAAHAEGMDQVEIYHMEDPNRRVVRLIEVSDAFPEGAVDRSGPNGMECVVPVFPMGPARGFPFQSEIAQVTAAEWSQLLQGTLQLNRNWGDLSNATRVRYAE